MTNNGKYDSLMLFHCQQLKINNLESFDKPILITQKI